MEMYVIAWRNSRTGQRGVGTEHHDLFTAEAICYDLNGRFDTINHWPKRVEFSTCDEDTQPIIVDEVDTLLLGDLREGD